MKWYADNPVRFGRQVAVDFLAAAWVAFWVWVVLLAHDAVLALRAPGDGLVSAGSGLRDAFTNAADRSRGVPLVGDDLADAFGVGTRAGEVLAGAGNSQIEVVQETAFWLAVALIVVPVLFLLVTWLPLRLRFAFRAGAARRLRDTGQHDLLALHALHTLRPRELVRIDENAAAAWRRGDPDVIEALAGRRLAALGVRWYVR